jgi:hypothetical protein
MALFVGNITNITGGENKWFKLKAHLSPIKQKSSFQRIFFDVSNADRSCAGTGSGGHRSAW